MLRILWNQMNGKYATKDIVSAFMLIFLFAGSFCADAFFMDKPLEYVVRQFMWAFAAFVLSYNYWEKRILFILSFGFLLLTICELIDEIRMKNTSVRPDDYYLFSMVVLCMIAAIFVDYTRPVIKRIYKSIFY